MVESLVACGVDVHVVALRGGAMESQLSAVGVEAVVVGRREAPPARLLAIIGRLHPFRPHVVQGTHFFTNLYAAGAARVLGAVSIGAIRNTLAYERAANRGWGGILLRAPDALVVNSDAARREVIAAGLAPSRVHFVPNALAPSVPHAGESAHVPFAAGPVAITVARLAPAKRVDLVLDALALAHTRTGGIRLLIVGDGPERSRLAARAHELGLRDGSVQFLGTRDDVSTLLAQADMFVLASDHEGTPNALLEAMQAGLPVVMTRTAGAGRLVERSGAGIVVECGDAEGLARAMVHLAVTPQARTAMGGAGLRVAAAHRGESLGAELLEVYRRCAEQRGDDRVRRLCTVTPGATRLPATPRRPGNPVRSSAQ